MVGCKEKTNLKTIPCLLAQGRSTMALFPQIAEGWKEIPCKKWQGQDTDSVFIILS